MAKVGWTEYTYIFFVDGNIIEQNSFLSDKDALNHAKKEAKERGKKVLVARWLEDEEYAQQSFAADGLTPRQKEEVLQITEKAIRNALNEAARR